MTDISIITPCLDMRTFLPLCVASVADQAGVRVEHIVCDGSSRDGCLEWLRSATGSAGDATMGSQAFERPHGYRRLAWQSEPDHGMYDAVNKGLLQAEAPLCAYLNADEQYLPVALARVVDFMARHPDVDILFGDVVVTDAAGDYICSRQVLRPRAAHTRFCHLNTFTAAMFFRRCLIDRQGLLFDASWRNLGDAEWMLRALRRGLRMAVIRQYLAAFADRGDNLNLQASAAVELARLRHGGGWQAHGVALWRLHHRLRRLGHGLYRPAPFAYAVYGPDIAAGRRVRDVARPTFFWPSRMREGRWWGMHRGQR